MNAVEEAKVLSYATPGALKPRVAPSAVVILAGLALVFLGGCFMIGIMSVNQHAGFGPPPVPLPPLTASDIIFELILYVLAFGCFASAVFLIALGVKWLARETKPA